MSTTTVVPAVPTELDRPTFRDDLRRLAALSRAEVRLLTRNTTAMVNAIIVPLGMAAVFGLISVGDLPVGTLVVTMIAVMGLSFVVYYTLVTTLVARRQELVLKRLRTGEAPSWVIIGAGAVPVIGLLIVQLIIGGGLTAVLLDLSLPANPMLIIVGVVVGALAWVLLAVVSSAYTATVESAQITTLPVLIVPLLLSGLAVPLGFLPDIVQTVAALTPLHPVVELFRLGMDGTTADGTALSLAGTFVAGVRPTLVLLGWTVGLSVLARRVFRWDPRR